MDRLKLSNSRFDSTTWTVLSLWEAYEKGKICFDEQPTPETYYSEDELIKCSEIIENMMIRLPMPPIYLQENKDNGFEVIRGCYNFAALYLCRNNILKFSGFNYYPELNGKIYKQMPRQFQRRIEQYNWPIVILRLEMYHHNTEDAIDRVLRMD